MPLIDLELFIAADRGIVFDLARSIDLHTISTEQTSEEAIAGVTSGLIGPGESVTWRARHFGVYQTLTAKITEFKAPEYFVDEMVSGAFKRFHHRHTFTAVEGGTVMRDKFDYTSPLGLLGRLADVIAVRKHMERLLLRRNETIKDFAETEKWRPLLSG